MNKRTIPVVATLAVAGVVLSMSALLWRSVRGAERYEATCRAIDGGTSWVEAKRLLDEQGSMGWGYGGPTGLPPTHYSFARRVALSRHQSCELAVDASGNVVSVTHKTWTDFDHWDSPAFPRRRYLGAILRRIAP